MTDEVSSILRENERRNEEIYAKFNPITGEGSTGGRVELVIEDFPIKKQWVPLVLLRVPLIRQVAEAGSIKAFLESFPSSDDPESDRLKVIEQIVRIRCRHDFPFWAATFVYIKRKGGGDDVLFRLTRPQRKFVEMLESCRLAGEPIRIVLLKARQWGGSTTSQLYMAWLQLMHRVGLNSLIIAHQGAGSDEIKDMFDRMIKAYPIDMLHSLGESYDKNEPKLVGVGKSGSIYRVPQRNCKIKIGTAERPDSCRGGDYNLVHLSEVGLWKVTDGKKPEDIVRSACSGILLKPYTMIVYESTANGTGNFFQREYDDAKDPSVASQFKALFISWFDIEQYSAPVENLEEFAAKLWENRHNNNVMNTREEPGRYLWSLWEKGATLEAINWYIGERSKYTDHGLMAAEYPSDDVEAFVNSGSRQFDAAQVEKFKSACRPPRLIGDVEGEAESGEKALQGLRIVEDKQGMFWVWELPETDGEEYVSDRYLAVVDIGGRSSKADFSVIVVFDRLFMADGGKPAVVAQWYGHIDHDRLAWKAAQIAALYGNALLVIESNTLETRDRDRSVDGDQSSFILSQIADVYPNLYTRKASEEDIREGRPTKYGFHTNVQTKPMIISTLTMVVRDGNYVERDKRCLEEYITYERKPNGAFGAIVGKHDDLLMTRAIGLHVCFNEMPLPVVYAKAPSYKVKKKAVSAASF
jgi:hypothetical protein